jgi:hypothetical protein
MRKRLHELGLAESDYSGHSFRKGATTDAMNNGIPEHDVRIMGRWKSDSVKLYYKLDPRRLYALSYQHQRGKAPPLFTNSYQRAST